MPYKRFSQRVREMLFDQKLVMTGAFLYGVSVFMPWYSDLDRFGTGFSFLGITGPLYLVGILFLVSGLVSLGTLFVNSVRQRVLNFGLEMRRFYTLSGSFLLFLLLLTNSVYFHENFGVNITSKDFRFGMVLAFVGVFLQLFGGLVTQKKSHSALHSDLFDAAHHRSENTENKPLVEFPQRDHGNISPENHQNHSSHSSDHQGRIDI